MPGRTRLRRRGPPGADGYAPSVRRAPATTVAPGGRFVRRAGPHFVRPSGVGADTHMGAPAGRTARRSSWGPARMTGGAGGATMELLLGAVPRRDRRARLLEELHAIYHLPQLDKLAAGRPEQVEPVECHLLARRRH